MLHHAEPRDSNASNKQRGVPVPRKNPGRSAAFIRFTAPALIAAGIAVALPVRLGPLRAAHVPSPEGASRFLLYEARLWAIIEIMMKIH